MQSNRRCRFGATALAVRPFVTAGLVILGGAGAVLAQPSSTGAGSTLNAGGTKKGGGTPPIITCPNPECRIVVQEGDTGPSICNSGTNVGFRIIQLQDFWSDLDTALEDTTFTVRVLPGSRGVLRRNNPADECNGQILTQGVDFAISGDLPDSAIVNFIADNVQDYSESDGGTGRLPYLSFQLTANDGSNDSNTETFDVVVMPENDRPVVRIFPGTPDCNSSVDDNRPPYPNASFASPMSGVFDPLFGDDGEYVGFVYGTRRLILFEDNHDLATNTEGNEAQREVHFPQFAIFDPGNGDDDLIDKDGNDWRTEGWDLANSPFVGTPNLFTDQTNDADPQFRVVGSPNEWWGELVVNLEKDEFTGGVNSIQYFRMAVQDRPLGGAVNSGRTSFPSPNVICSENFLDPCNCFSIEVIAVNDEPLGDAESIVMCEDGQPLVLGDWECFEEDGKQWVRFIDWVHFDLGPENEQSIQKLDSFIIDEIFDPGRVLLRDGADNPYLRIVPNNANPALATAGHVELCLCENKFTDPDNGIPEIQVTFRVRDDGGTEAHSQDGSISIEEGDALYPVGRDTSDEIRFNIEVRPVNDPPEFNPPGNDEACTAQAVDQLRVLPAFINGIAPGPLMTCDGNAVFPFDESDQSFNPATAFTVTVMSAEDGDGVPIVPPSDFFTSEPILEFNDDMTEAELRYQAAGPGHAVIAVTLTDNAMLEGEPWTNPDCDSPDDDPFDPCDQDDPRRVSCCDDNSAEFEFELFIITGPVIDGPGTVAVCQDEEGLLTFPDYVSALPGTDGNTVDMMVTSVGCPENFTQQPFLTPNGVTPNSWDLNFQLAPGAFTPCDDLCQIEVTATEEGADPECAMATACGYIFIAPSLQAIAQNLCEDDGRQLVNVPAGIATVPGNCAGNLSFAITSVDAPAGLFSETPNLNVAGTVLRYRGAQNAYGDATVHFDVTYTLNVAPCNNPEGEPVEVTVTCPFDLPIHIEFVNDAPSITVANDCDLNALCVCEDQGQVTISNWATCDQDGKDNNQIPETEGDQTCSFVVDCTGYEHLFTVLPAVDANGTLTFTLAPNACGLVQCSIFAMDDGGTGSAECPGEDTSDTLDFCIDIFCVNDPPTIQVSNIVLCEDDGMYMQAGWAVVDTDGKPNENTEPEQTWTVAIDCTGYEDLFLVLPTVDSTGKISFTPAPNAYGVAQCTATATDSGGAEVCPCDDTFVGDNTSDAAPFTITIREENDQPELTPVKTEFEICEDGGLICGGTYYPPGGGAPADCLCVFDPDTGLSAGKEEDDHQDVVLIEVYEIAGCTELLNGLPTVGLDGKLVFDLRQGAMACDDPSCMITFKIRAVDNGATPGSNACDHINKSDPVDIKITIYPANDPPSIECIGRIQIENNQPVVLGDVDGNGFFDTTPAVMVNDCDAGTGSLKVTLSVLYGTLSGADNGACTVMGSGTGTLMVQGPLSCINNTLANVVYTPDCENSPDTFNLHALVSDLGNTGCGPGELTADCDISIRCVEECECYWENGRPDDQKYDGQRSHDNGVNINSPRSEHARAADDFCLDACYVWNVYQIFGWVITNTDEPDAIVEIYRDCDGCPEDEPVYTFPLTEFTHVEDLDDGYSVYKYTFDIDSLWLKGGECYWVSIAGIEQYFDATKETFFAATDGTVLGIESDLRAAVAKARDDITDTPLPDEWTSAAEINLHCRELAFAVCAEPCPIICDNGMYGDTGSESATNTTRPNTRVADNFVLEPCHDYTICYVRGYVATNCNPDNGLLEIYENSCFTGEEDQNGNVIYGDTPIGSPICSAPVTNWIDTGETTEIDGKVLPIYCYEFYGFDCELMGNANYWVSIINRGTGSLNERGYFLHNVVCVPERNGTPVDRDGFCEIKISEGRFISPGGGYRSWTRVSELGAGPHDFAFLIAGTIDDGATAPISGCWVDVNGDGVVNGLDMGLFLNAYSEGCQTP